MEISKNKSREEVIEAFSLMWGNYPAPVMLITYKHDIIAVNEIYQQYGVSTGQKCSSLPGNHKGCRAGEAKMSGKPVRCVAQAENSVVYDGYWIPVEGEYLIHFGNDITQYADIEKVNASD
ncbi:conserved hypothetical protein [Denitrovibrio acetiphilus DSM 12809]|jgi:hypothetical protein|uniref:Uncharacterized protein n=1 Tax=Denitrovibrio acetiphilus (strain DSM 12809 / NBRC 114555 / N2460) TaxID=522772 RepID=D4H894_DENA2|nr:hypothetical protein [Denitrovibrio acetiphilus]ADD68243.1 conserved hypothetical protein [Denitrovibrio acetiphilus DSM 12809]